MRSDPAAVIDDDVLQLQTHDSLEQIHHILVLCQAEGLVRPVVFWRCPNGFGTTKEADHVGDLPQQIECDRCGQTHWYSAQDVEIRFVATQLLTNSLGA